ncbi:hypothetical protein BS47DRAFT_1391892 [Hydnum rufescens UP504]|uniref:Uncharacterized protein n=1 Tax=Hydnum rufescens UP504 TaxID=1448309 RepID=A0A9P6B010_9AGAM|nr:hypothetical protein BS47DRAFT_1391892 [Hydnum rufescens UP504]
MNNRDQPIAYGAPGSTLDVGGSFLQSEGSGTGIDLRHFLFDLIGDISDLWDELPYPEEAEQDDRVNLEGRAERNLRKGQERSRSRLAKKKKAEANVIRLAEVDALDLPVSSTGWTHKSGSYRRCVKNELDTLLQDIGRTQFVLSQLRHIPFIRAPTMVLDAANRLIVLRSFEFEYMDQNFMMSLLQRLDTLFTKSSVVPTAEREKNVRGKFLFCIMGWSRSYSPIPTRGIWETKNSRFIEEFLDSGEFAAVCMEMSRILERWFPKYAARCAASNEWWKSRTQGFVAMKFGYFFNCCVNVAEATPGTPPADVKCGPHVDYKNIAGGVCALYVIGFFNHGERCWLVCWETQLIIEIPPGIYLLYPSSLVFHWNADRREFYTGDTQMEMVTTSNWELPVPENTSPLRRISSGRGSIVFFNQASMFQSSELDSASVEMAKSEGKSGGTDYAAKANEGYTSFHLL